MKSRKLIQIMALVLLAVFMLTGCSSAASVTLTGGILPARLFTAAETPSPSPEEEVEAGTEEAPEMTGLSVTMLDVGQGLGLVIQADGYTMLYDGGPAPDDSAADKTYPVIAWLEEHKVESIDLMIASHYDTDHISGLIKVMRTYPVKTILCGDYNDGTNVCKAFHRQLKKIETEMNHPQVGEVYTLGNLQVEILSPLNYEYKDENEVVPDEVTKTENDDSIAVRLNYGDFHCVITGDAQEAAELDMLDQAADKKIDLSADLYVCGHHGSSTSSSEEFVAAISPAYAFISCGKDNTYGQPTEQTLETLKAAGVQIFRTDTQGTVTCTSDGKSYAFDQKPTDNWEPGVYVPESSTGSSSTAAAASTVASAGAAAAGTETTSTEEQTAEGVDTENFNYIVNKNTLVIHHSYCDSVNDMSEKNKWYSNWSVEELEAAGYRTCKRCF